ncbi:uncharacterized protein GIQ15_02693 [Arthroderma uncinatum]|uniref:uncharacterized protein n=1 Tax=Arthroderma uncinatum TaxID=74035 RepID=UPI00144AF765|nr:uncharacterized protein GIQ15_02693 [Arthroderma uncinatum]KAF3483369.1 hypothetical protein GIQ15_02693 [Arthroderma uncinatum]
MLDPSQAAQDEDPNQGHIISHEDRDVSETIMQVNDDYSSSSLTVDICVEAMEGMAMQDPRSSNDRAAPVDIRNKHAANISSKKPHKRSDTPRRVFRRYVSMPHILRTRIQVIQHQIEVCKSSLTPNHILTGKDCQTKTPFLVRRVRPRATFSRKPTPRIVRTGWSTINKRVGLMEVPEIMEADWTECVEETLHLRGGCGGWMNKKGKIQRLEDDEELPPIIWWVAGGKPGYPLPTGKRLREWKTKSKGKWQEDQRRGYLQEFVFVMSEGRLCRNQPERKIKGKNDVKTKKAKGPDDLAEGGSSILAPG